VAKIGDALKILILTRLTKSSDESFDKNWTGTHYLPALRLLVYLSDRHKHEVDITEYPPDAIAFCDYDLVVLYFYPHILKAEHIDAPRYGIINCHNSYLPYNRSANANVWSIIDQDSICGVTIHKIDEGIDTGNILARKVVDVSPVDTGKSLYYKLERSAYDLWIEYWPVLESLIESTGTLPPGIVQDESYATYHKRSDLNEIDDLESYLGYYTSRELIDILRARTFPPYKGAYIRDENGRKIYVRIELEYEDEVV
jgi:methionyl-tRNA formyltransferase